MSLLGTVVSGVIVLDGNTKLPEGARVRVVVGEEAFDDYPPPPTADTHEEHLEALRESIEEMKAGIGGIEARQFLKDLAIKHNHPLEPRE